MAKGIIITKQSGLEESFDPEKVIRSLMSSGASRKIAEEVVEKLLREISPGISTRKIFRLARKHLRRMDRPAGIRYRLKEAIYSLGPSGYPFENFISRLFEAMGYKTKVGQIVKGRCVSHEVDVIASREDETLMMECKFHRNAKQVSDVKIALYVESRFRDIRAAMPDGANHTGALVTNTRLSSEAVKYAECTGLRTIAWKYPAKDSLEGLITRTRAYPVTLLPAANRSNLHALMDRGLVLATDLAHMAPEELSAMAGLNIKESERLVKQSLETCRSNSVCGEGPEDGKKTF